VYVQALGIKKTKTLSLRRRSVAVTEKRFPNTITRCSPNKALLFKTVVFNFFHATTHSATQFNLTTPFRKFTVKHIKCSCVCTRENHNDQEITYDIIMLNGDSFIKFMHMATSVRKRPVQFRLCCNQFVLLSECHEWSTVPINRTVWYSQ